MHKMRILRLTLSSLITIMPMLAHGDQPDTPYLANPVSLHRYINKTVPNIAIVIDNSNIMNEQMETFSPTLQKPRYIDIVKGALLSSYPDTYGIYNLSLVTLTDVAKDMHWQQDSTQASGYLFAPGINDENIFYDSTAGFNPYNIAPIASNGQLQRSIGSGNGKQNYGFNKYKGSLLIGDVQTKQEYLPGFTELQKNTLGLTLLVPLLNTFGSNAIFEEHQKNLNLLTKTISLSSGRMRDVLPNTVEYLANNIKYRCQDSYIIVITNDIDEIIDEVNLKAVGQYAKQHPKSNLEKDAEGKLYNQSDFPNQYIKTYLLALNYNQGTGINETSEHIKDILHFGTEGGGAGIVAINAEEVQPFIQGFLKEMRGGVFFTGSAPAVYAGKNPDTGENEQVWITSVSDPEGWFGDVRMSTAIDDESYKTMYYAQGYPQVYLNTGQNVALLSLRGDISGIVQSRDTLKSSDFKLNNQADVSSFIAWLIGEDPTFGNSQYIGDDVYPQYRYRSNDIFSNKRYLGDITNDTVEIMGTYKSSVKAPNLLLVGSNDGMLKIYRANPLYDIQDDPNLPSMSDLSEPFPYVYEFAYMPGGAKRQDGSKLMENWKYRADPAYGDESNKPVHEYGISGQIAYRTTNKGQTFMVGSLGQGGFGAFALNVAGNAHHDQNVKLGIESKPRSDWGTNSFLWDTSSTAFGAAKDGSEAIGHILGRPVIARIAESRTNGLPDMKKDVRYVAVLPSGEFGDQTKDSGPTLYIYDAIGVNVAIDKNKKDITPGKLIQKVTANVPKGTKLKYKNSLSAPILVDLTFDGVADIGYVGDLNGHLYRLDLRGNKPSDWTLDLIYEGNPSQPIIQAPSISRFDQKNVVIFGTGSYDKKGDFDEYYEQQALYGIFENDDFTGFNDGPLNSQSNFVDQILSTNMDDDIRSISNNKIEDEHDGWRILLSRSANEALAQKPVVFNGSVFLQTYVLHEKNAMPDSAICYRPTLSPDTWLFQINARTGGLLDSDEDTRLKEMGGNHVMQFDGLVLPTLKLVRTDESSSMSKDGEMQNGNDRDFDLIELESLPSSNVLKKSHYLNAEGECNAIVTNGMTLICPPYIEVLKPTRISIMKRNVHN